MSKSNITKAEIEILIGLVSEKITYLEDLIVETGNADGRGEYLTEHLILKSKLLKK